MADPFPPPRDHSLSSQEAPLAPRRDPTPRAIDDAGRPSLLERVAFPHSRADATIRFLSRWAGPAALIATLVVGIWLLLR